MHHVCCVCVMHRFAFGIPAGLYVYGMYSRKHVLACSRIAAQQMYRISQIGYYGYQSGCYGVAMQLIRFQVVLGSCDDVPGNNCIIGIIFSGFFGACPIHVDGYKSTTSSHQQEHICLSAAASTPKRRNTHTTGIQVYRTDYSHCSYR